MVLDRYPRFTDLLVNHLKSIDSSFNLEECLDWVNTMEHDPPMSLNTSYIEWKALHRFIHLLSEQKAGTLDHWQHYPSQKLKEPASDEFCDVLQAYEKALNNEGFKVETARTYELPALLTSVMTHFGIILNPPDSIIVLQAALRMKSVAFESSFCFLKIKG